MATEKRLIDGTLLLKDKTILWDEALGFCDCVLVEDIEKAPTVDAVELPCKIGDDVYIIPSKVNYDLNVFSGFKNNNRVYHQKVAEIVFSKNCWYALGDADKAYGTGNVLLDRFFKETWFLTREEAEDALAKMDGDGNG